MSHDGGGDDDAKSVQSAAAGHARLYELLQVEPSIPAKEISKTFKDLTLRKQYRGAFNILSNPDKKRLYDIVGEGGVDPLESKTWGSVVAVIGSLLSVIIYGLGWIATAVLLSLFFIFLPLHVDGWSGTWTWWEVLIPLFILFSGGAAMALITILIAIIAPKEKGDNILAFRHPIVKFLVMAGYTAFVFIVGAVLNGRLAKTRWIYYFIILIVVDLVSIVEWMSWKYPVRIRRLLEPIAKNTISEQDMASGNFGDNANPSCDLVYGFMVIGGIDFLLAAARWIFIALKLDGDLTWDWYYILIPVALRFCTSIAYRMHQARIYKALNQKTFCGLIWTFIGTFFFNSCLITATFLIAWHLQTGNSAAGGLDLVYAIIPIYVVLFYLLVAAIFTFFYLIISECLVSSLEEDEERRLREDDPNYGNDDQGGNDPDYHAGARGSQDVSSMGTESVISDDTVVETDPDDELNGGGGGGAAHEPFAENEPSEDDAGGDGEEMEELGDDDDDDGKKESDVASNDAVASSDIPPVSDSTR